MRNQAGAGSNGKLDPNNHLPASAQFPILAVGHVPRNGRAEAGLDFAKVLQAIASFFDQEGFHYAVAGAFALFAYGLTRATQDLDFVTVSEARLKLLLFLESLGYTTVHASSGYSTHLHENPEMGRLDFIYTSGETSCRLFEEMKTTLSLGGVTVPVPRREHLIAMKIQAMKNDPARTFQEMADIQFLMGLPGIDDAEVQEYFDRQGLLERYREIKKALQGY